MTEGNPPQFKTTEIFEFFSSSKYYDALESIVLLSKDYPDSPLLHNISGACYAGLGNFENAVKLYNKALLINPSYSKAHYNLGGVLQEMGRLHEAINSYKNSLEIDPVYAEAHNNLGNVYKELDQYDAALESFQNALNINPEYIEARYNLGLTLQKLGQDTSIKNFKKVLEVKPDFAEAHNNLGVVLKSAGDLNQAIKSFKDATNINPRFFEAFNNLGNAFMDIDELDDAVKSYEQAIAINPESPQLINNLGNAYKKLGRLKNAVNSYEKAIKIDPITPSFHNNLGVAYYDSGLLDKAISAYKKALSIDPEYAEALNNLGTVYKDLGNYKDAINYFKQSITISPMYSDAYSNLGVVFKKIGQLDNSIKSYNKALSINHKDADTLNNLGIALDNNESLNEAINAYESSLKYRPNYADAYNNLGITYTKLRQFDEAKKANDNALKLKPDFAEGFAARGRIFTELKKIDEALLCFQRANDINPSLAYNFGSILNAKMNICDWHNLPSLLDQLNIKISNNEMAIVPFDLLGLIDDPELQGKSSKIYADNEFPKNESLPKLECYSEHLKIRVGYFSADFRMHPVATLTAELYEMHDRDYFEIFAFSFGPNTQDDMTRRIKDGVDHFYNVSSMSDQEIALLSRSLEIDIAIDLGGYTADSRTGIFAISAAPIQVSYIGVLSSMGSKYYDYLIAGKTMIPKRNQKFFTEKIAYLPSYQVNDSKELPPDIKINRKDLGLPEEGFIFCCFNNTFKITPAVFDSWSRILEQVEHSILFLYADNNNAKLNLTKEISKRGIDVNRLFFGESLPRDQYLARYRVADLFLDTRPYNAGTTASDAMRMGLPVLTLKGNSFNSREASSIINSLNLPELITSTEEDYESLAIKLAKQPKKYLKIKDKLLANLSTAPLYKTALFTKNIESAYKAMYERNQNGLDPEHIIVE